DVMTGKADFSAEEWDLVREGPPTAGLVTLTAEKGGTFRESWALAKTYAEARKEHGESELLDALVAEKPDLKRRSSPEELEQVGLGNLTEAVMLPEQRAARSRAKSQTCGRRSAPPTGWRRRALGRERGAGASPASGRHCSRTGSGSPPRRSTHRRRAARPPARSAAIARPVTRSGLRS